MNRYTIFGNPVSHSKSPSMQNAGFKYLGLDCLYDKTQIKKQNIKDIFKQRDLSGANITLPHKEVAYELADIVVGEANKIKAVNTYIKRGDKIVAYNTDGSGFMMAIKEFLPISSALIIGAGGTAKAIAVALIEANIQTTVANRTASKLKFFKDIGAKTTSTKNLNTNYIYNLIINATSVGLIDDTTPIPINNLKKILKNCSYAFDCIYNKNTKFLSLSKMFCIKCKSGEDMLLYQGVKALELWTKATKGLIKCMRDALVNNTIS